MITDFLYLRLRGIKRLKRKNIVEAKGAKRNSVVSADISERSNSHARVWLPKRSSHSSARVISHVFPSLALTPRLSLRSVGSGVNDIKYLCLLYKRGCALCVQRLRFSFFPPLTHNFLRLTRAEAFYDELSEREAGGNRLMHDPWWCFISFAHLVHHHLQSQKPRELWKLLPRSIAKTIVSFMHMWCEDGVIRPHPNHRLEPHFLTFMPLTLDSKRDW